METSRKIKLSEVEAALVFLRDHVLTDQNITTVFAVVDKMSVMFGTIYDGIKGILKKDTIEQGDISGAPAETEELFSELQVRAKERGLEHEVEPFKNDLIDNTYVVRNTAHLLGLDSEERASRDIISIDSILDAIQFLSTHTQTVGSILEDLQKIFESFSQVTIWKEQQDEVEEEELVSEGTGRSLDKEKVRLLYEQLSGGTATKL